VTERPAQSSANLVLNRLGGTNAVTIWTWVVTAPFAVTVMSGVQYVGSGESSWAAVLVAAVAHIGTGFLLLVARGAIELAPRRHRPPVALLTFAVIGAARPFLMLWSADLLDVNVTVGDLWSRVVINVLVCVTVFSLIALVVDLVHEDRIVFARLRAVQRAAAAATDAGRRHIQELRESRTTLVLDAIEGGLREIERPGLERSQASALLRSLANDVVRPLSHELYDVDEIAPPGADPDPDVQPWTRQWIVAVAGGMRAAPALFTAVLFALLVLPYALAVYELVLSLVQTAIALILVAGCNRVVAELALRASSGARRFATLVVGYVVTAGLLVVESLVLLTAFGFTVRFVWFQGVLYPVIALAIAFVTSLAARLDADQAELERSIVESVETASRVRSAYEHERKRLAHLLHTTVQSDLIATALALRADASVDASTAVRGAVERIHRALDANTSERPSARDRLEGVIDAWRSAMLLQARIDDGAWPSLADDPRCQAVIDVVSEGLANAVRHGDGSPVELVIEPEGDGVRIRVTSGGRVRAGRAGIGLRDLATTGETRLRQSAAGVELAVSIP
jgi:signal transduction histidine kinase